MTFSMEGDDDFAELAKFLLPTPNKETGIHHFSRLKCLSLGGPQMDFFGPLDYFKDKKQVNVAFPAVSELVLGDVRLFPNVDFDEPDIIANLAWNLLELRAPYLESLHLARVRLDREKGTEKEELPVFSSLAELCLAGTGALVWLEHIGKKIKEGEVTEWNLDKIHFGFRDEKKVRPN